MSFSPIKIFFLAAAAAVLSGCIADSAEESNLPWSSQKSWEGLVPVARGLMDRYD